VFGGGVGGINLRELGELIWVWAGWVVGEGCSWVVTVGFAFSGFGSFALQGLCVDNGVRLGFAPRKHY
jgi:hypothetical protein